MSDIINTKRPIEEIIEDIKKIKSEMANTNSSEKIDDMAITYRSIDELKDILIILENELKDAQGQDTQKWVSGVRRGFGTWR